MMKNSDFCVFIISHGRPDKVITINTLLKAGYTGRYFIVIDNEDKTESEYLKNFRDKVIKFDKKSVADTTDEGDNFNNRRTTTHARNACFEIAQKLGYTYFLVFDDDYNQLNYSFTPDSKYCDTKYPIKNIDSVFDSFIDYFKIIDCKSLAFAQGGDFIGGNKPILLKRKCMNSWFCSTERPFKFIGRLNEDVNTYVSHATKGMLFLTAYNVRLNQAATQATAGGMTEAYLHGGTYVKSFYTVMYQPSSVKISTIGYLHPRIHHKIKWACTVPVIVDPKFKKHGTQ